MAKWPPIEEPDYIRRSNESKSRHYVVLLTIFTLCCRIGFTLWVAHWLWEIATGVTHYEWTFFNTGLVVCAVWVVFNFFKSSKGTK